ELRSSNGEFGFPHSGFIPQSSVTIPRVFPRLCSACTDMFGACAPCAEQQRRNESWRACSGMCLACRRKHYGFRPRASVLELGCPLPLLFFGAVGIPARLALSKASEDSRTPRRWRDF